MVDIVDIVDTVDIVDIVDMVGTVEKVLKVEPPGNPTWRTKGSWWMIIGRLASRSLQILASISHLA